jgi:hypothetical protein
MPVNASREIQVRAIPELVGTKPSRKDWWPAELAFAFLEIGRSGGHGLLVQASYVAVDLRDWSTHQRTSRHVRKTFEADVYVHRPFFW